MFNPNNFQGTTDSWNIQQAINAAAASTDRTVIIPRNNNRTNGDIWEIEKTILLPNEITVILDGCHLRLKDGVYENIFRNENMYNPGCLNAAGEQYGIHIVGMNDPILDGGKDNGLREQEYFRKKEGPTPRTGNLILLNNVRDYSIEGIRCINMRYWAINQIACRGGRLRHISFCNGDHHPNQDGINLRIGCYDIIIEDITGRTGDDVVALSAFPVGSDRVLLPEGRSPDIHHVTVRDVNAHTRQTIIVLRNCDGAKLYHILIENISDCGGKYGPWGIVRIGENNYYSKRSNILGETYDITLRNIRSMARGTIYLSSSLMDSHISDVYAGGDSMYAISTYQPTFVFWENDCYVSGGVSLKNVLIENVYYNGLAAHCDEEALTDVNEPFNGCALDFRKMRDSDTLENVRFRNINTKDGSDLFLVKEGITLDIQ